MTPHDDAGRAVLFAADAWRDVYDARPGPDDVLPPIAAAEADLRAAVDRWRATHPAALPAGVFHHDRDPGST